MAKRFWKRRREYLLDILQNCRKLNSMGKSASNAKQIKNYSQTVPVFRAENMKRWPFQAVGRDALFNLSMQCSNSNYNFFK